MQGVGPLLIPRISNLTCPYPLDVHNPIGRRHVDEKHHNCVYINVSAHVCVLVKKKERNGVLRSPRAFAVVLARSLRGQDGPAPLGPRVEAAAGGGGVEGEEGVVLSGGVGGGGRVGGWDHVPGGGGGGRGAAGLGVPHPLLPQGPVRHASISSPISYYNRSQLHTKYLYYYFPTILIMFY